MIIKFVFSSQNVHVERSHHDFIEKTQLTSFTLIFIDSDTQISADIDVAIQKCLNFLSWKKDS